MVSSFPRLIAAAHVLHRLLAPRHPPCALILLIRKNTFYCRYGVFKVRVDTSAHRVDGAKRLESQHSLSKLNSVTGSRKSRIEVDVFPGPASDGPRAIS